MWPPPIHPGGDRGDHGPFAGGAANVSVGRAASHCRAGVHRPADRFGHLRQPGKKPELCLPPNERSWSPAERQTRGAGARAAQQGDPEGLRPAMTGLHAKGVQRRAAPGHRRFRHGRPSGSPEGHWTNWPACAARLQLLPRHDPEGEGATTATPAGGTTPKTQTRARNPRPGTRTIVLVAAEEVVPLMPPARAGAALPTAAARFPPSRCARGGAAACDRDAGKGRGQPGGHAGRPGRPDRPARSARIPNPAGRRATAEALEMYGQGWGEVHAANCSPP